MKRPANTQETDKAFPLSAYPPPIRRQMLNELSVIEIVYATQTDKELAKWMRKMKIWDEIWVEKVQQPGDERVGSIKRFNCLAWFIARQLKQYNKFEEAFFFKGHSVTLAQVKEFDHIDVSTVKVFNFKWFFQLIDMPLTDEKVSELIAHNEVYGLPNVKLIIAYGYYHSLLFKGYSDTFGTYQAESMRAKIIYVLLEMGYSWKFNSRREYTYPIRSEVL